VAGLPPALLRLHCILIPYLFTTKLRIEKRQTHPAWRRAIHEKDPMICYEAHHLTRSMQRHPRPVLFLLQFALLLELLVPLHLFLRIRLCLLQAVLLRRGWRRQVHVGKASELAFDQQ
jgi:hypothetical protein